MTESFLARFEGVLGDLNSWVYADAVRRDNLTTPRKLASPVRKVVEEIVSDCNGLLSCWRMDDSLGYGAASSIIWNLDGGRLADVLKDVDLLMNFIANEKRIDLPRPKVRILDIYENNLSRLLELLSRLIRDETPLLTEELMALAAIRDSLMTKTQIAALEKARTLADEVWHSGGSYEIIGEFRTLMEPILENVYPLEPRNWSCMKTDEAHRLLKRLKEVHEDLEVTELWDNLTSA